MILPKTPPNTGSGGGDVEHGCRRDKIIEFMSGTLP
jgi:hypothetical protein